ncbi:nif-specific transcriptional activator NifA [Sediminispirochaeta smaragdinae]|uniref:Nif-specific regulatory protein n=1 Tax=Sediminispirochaeta smaragdinae (strain DSM 11293 / JCM 15392 / SEBR 4228) TaxID=573413 RepID=E1RCJ5_SEDSS|nr:nif-specific transcriptional activator NifA [Sediminispirochaeta smaragdinae]ADK80075.1 transcriptional regulator, NifA subfamily, Fis Family [Sediminispirochaeta smaragdinae DSM 11293]
MEESSEHYRRKIAELELLFEVSQTLDRSLEIEDAIQPVLELLREHVQLRNGMVTLMNRHTGLITIESATELSREAQKKGVYKPGEGITGQVVASGEAIVIPDIKKDKRFLNKTGTSIPGGKVSFISVPVTHNRDIMGTISAMRVGGDEMSSDEDFRILTIIASMIAQAVRLRRQIEEEKQRLEEENNRLKKELEERYRPRNIIGSSAAMKEVYALISQVAPSDTTVLIRGESGTGKELIAHAIHYASPRQKGPFIKVNCAALPEGVIESELFGHEKGAFTGAHQSRKGRFELADGGTIFLDEIGDLSPATQVKLLRVLQEREFERVGGVQTVKVDVRIVAATNRNLEEFIAENRFREDLYYRLAVFPIHVPPLRKRKSDILQLADFFAEKYGHKQGKRIKRISTPAIELLSIYHWPGNVRELENVIERAVLLSTDGVIHGHHLPPTLQSAESSDTRFKGTLQDEVEKFEKELLQEALKSSQGNAAQAARNLGITERIMGLRIHKYEIDTSRFKPR